MSKRTHRGEKSKKRDKKIRCNRPSANKSTDKQSASEPKETQIKEYLDKWMKHFKKSSRGSNRFIDELKTELFKKVLNYFEANGWASTYSWVKEQQLKFAGDNRKGPINMTAGFKQVRDKMWSLERKESKG